MQLCVVLRVVCRAKSWGRPSAGTAHTMVGTLSSRIGNPPIRSFILQTSCVSRFSSVILSRCLRRISDNTHAPFAYIL